MKFNVPFFLRIGTLGALTLLAACGKYGELEPQPGAKPAPVAFGRDKPESPDQLLTPPAQARPGRSVEILSRSVRREDDPFDLPPGSQPEVDASNAANSAQPDETAAAPGDEDEPK
ncbi:MAG: hypothetical protein HC843_09785 [Sphingomonadales bacterium]|nr:hypothetical protein [Sphingomonadales bacterium]